MQAVMLSIHPKWCKKIATGEKTVEVRKTAPKIRTPFKCYIYCTQGVGENTFNVPISAERLRADVTRNGMKSMNCEIGNGKVWAEFICDAVLTMSFSCSDPAALATNYQVPKTGLSDVEIMKYIGNGKTGYGWCISELKIYDHPRELSEFRRVCWNDLYCDSCAMYNTHTETCGNAALQLHRPPQSWCYVEEIAV